MLEFLEINTYFGKWWKNQFSHCCNFTSNLTTFELHKIESQYRFYIVESLFELFKVKLVLNLMIWKNWVTFYGGKIQNSAHVTSLYFSSTYLFCFSAFFWAPCIICWVLSKRALSKTSRISSGLPKCASEKNTWYYKFFFV